MCRFYYARHRGTIPIGSTSCSCSPSDQFLLLREWETDRLNLVLAAGPIPSESFPSLPFTIIFLEQKVCDTMQNASKGSVSVTHPYRNGDRIIGQKAAKILSRRKSGKMSKIKVIPAS
jgi:hypothetical protein